MKNHPRILVFRLKELIYTGIFILLGILFIILMICMFRTKDSDSSASAGEQTIPSRPASTQHQVSSYKDTAKQNNDSSDLNNKDSELNKEDSEQTKENSEQTKENSEQTKENSEQLSSETNANITNIAYIPGVYSSSLILNNSTMEIQVCVDANHINDISIVNIDEAITTMYPLMENSMNDICNQVVSRQSLEQISYSEDSRYTYMILLDAIRTTLNKAKKTEA